jgi:formate/nitrite transporter FocA (FNT family)
MADHGTRRLQRLSVVQILVLAMLAGGFVTVGALFSVLLATGIGSPGAQRLVEGLGFSAGFFFVILMSVSGSAVRQTRCLVAAGR